MTPNPYTEAPLVQETTAENLESLDWESVHAPGEDFGRACPLSETTFGSFRRVYAAVTP